MRTNNDDQMTFEQFLIGLIILVMCVVCVMTWVAPWASPICQNREIHGTISRIWIEEGRWADYYIAVRNANGVETIEVTTAQWAQFEKGDRVHLEIVDCGWAPSLYRVVEVDHE